MLLDDRKRQPVIKVLPYKEILGFGEFCLFTTRNLDMINNFRCRQEKASGCLVHNVNIPKSELRIQTWKILAMRKTNLITKTESI